MNLQTALTSSPLLSNDYNPEKLQVICHHNVCMTSSLLSVGLYHPETGGYAWHKLKSIEQLETFINFELLMGTHIPHHGFCLIRCRNPVKRQITQLLILLPFLQTTLEASERSRTTVPLLNVNILLLDSVSRHHFYRTLVKTIDAFRHLNRHEFSHGQVFDFKLVQGIKGRTFESLQALFGGKVAFHPVFDSYSLPTNPVDLNETFGKFKAYGYETLYVEDMCWLGEWGLVKELAVMNQSASFSVRARAFKEAILRAGIDRIDVSYSSCRILQENKVKDMFHGPDAICFNGIHQHSYLLQYIQFFVTHFSSMKKPTFTFLILDTGHEDTGLRIKQLDTELANHVLFLAKQHNTVSFILSDHGNTYGRFFAASTEAQAEVFHPSLFIIVPEHASKVLGSRKMKSLRLNQNRLISLIDVHHTLKSLLPSDKFLEKESLKYSISINGLLSPVSVNRSCTDIPRLHPNLCICQAYYISQRNDSYYALFAEFALGYLNNLILEQQKGTNGTCLRLIATRFENVQSSGMSVSPTEVIVKLDLYVRILERVSNEDEMFTVSVQFNVVNNIGVLIFLGYDRLTSYSRYRICADPAVDLRLCICDMSAVQRNTTVHNREHAILESVLWTVTHRTAIHDPCLYLLTRNYTTGIVLLVHNTCTDAQYHVRFDFMTKNLHSSSKMPIDLVIEPVREKLLVTGIRKVDNQPWKCKYILNYTVFPL
ncbi:uncharacterized protein LOC115090280 isoform X2 [Rhinatrema bivittatum]|uniref:uncharacterized protein LOC115090280 isoform X2 n=1 Tax=Rhinatrema bivittatum TaxID=194408 RepID=UPI001127B0FB|nr:uncharacterized protein LOC115090280 isoform X2 [Rhinatrema bivittatum]